MTDKAMTNKPTVNFYILSDSDLDNRLLFVYRLLEKADEQQLSTVIITNDEAQLDAIDRLIWTAKPEQFLAHEIVTEKTCDLLPNILITQDITNIQQLDFNPQIVIDLNYDATPLNFPKIMLVANQHPEILPNARLKYQAYVNHGVKPVVHKINTAAII